MSDANALESQGTILRVRQAGSPGGFVQVLEAKDIAFRTGSATVNDVTDITSQSRLKRSGLPDEGQCTFTLHFRPRLGSHTELLDAREDRQPREFEIVFTDESPATTYRFDAFVVSLPIQAPTDGVIETPAVLEITGPVREYVAAQTTVSTYQDAPTTTAHEVPMPDNEEIGDVLLVCYSCDKAGSTSLTLNTAMSGLNWAGSQVEGAGSTGWAGVLWKVAEGGDQLRFDTNVGEQFSAIVFRFKQRSTVSIAAGPSTAASTSPNPPESTPTMGVWDWVAFAMSAPADPPEPVQSLFTGYPSGYAETTTVAGNANNPSIATAIKRATAAPENPGAFATNISALSVAFTIGVQ